ncbi:hypothetical protein [Spirosoma knui]
MKCTRYHRNGLSIDRYGGLYGSKGAVGNLFFDQRNPAMATWPETHKPST